MILSDKETFDKVKALFDNRYDIATYCGVRYDGLVIFRMQGLAKTIGVIAYITKDFKLKETKDIVISYYRGHGNPIEKVTVPR